MSDLLLPLYQRDAFGYFTGLLLGTLIGVGFGFTLERAGFGRARNLAAQFYLTDTRVLKVMFTAIVTAAAGMALLSGAGLLDLSRVQVPETYLWPHLVGGLVLGAGFIISGYCPGTAVVAAASGNLDGAMSLLGTIAGSVLFGFVYPSLESFYTSGAMGSVRLDHLLGVPHAMVVAGVVAMAIGAFLLGEKLERTFCRKLGETAPDSPRPVKTRVFASLSAVAALALAALAIPDARREAPPRERVPMDAVVLARRIAAAPQGLWILDLRPESVAAKGRIPGAFGLPPEDAEGKTVAGLPHTRDLVVYAERDTASLAAGVTQYAGNLYILRGGYAAWTASVLTAPTPPESPTPALVAEFQLRNALFSRFTGAEAAEPVKVTIRPAAAPASVPKKGGGC